MGLEAFLQLLQRGPLCGPTSSAALACIHTLLVVTRAWDGARTCTHVHAQGSVVLLAVDVVQPGDGILADCE